MQIHRLIETVFILLNKDKVSAKELADKFEVSPRTIYRDIDILSFAGIPVITDKGNGGGIRIEKSYRINNTILNESEQNELLMLLNSQLLTNNQENEKILYKLSSIFNKNADNFIEIDFSDWRNEESERDKFGILKKSILEKRKIIFDYYGTYNGYGLKEVEPLKLIFKHISWYLYGYCEANSDFRIYKINRMQNIRITDNYFVRKCDKKDIANDRNWNEELCSVEIEFDISVAGLVYDYFNIKDIEISDKILRVKTMMPVNEFTVSYFLGFNDKAKIIEPEILIDMIKTSAKKITDLYE